MKKKILAFSVVLVAVSLTAYGLIDQYRSNQPNQVELFTQQTDLVPLTLSSILKLEESTRDFPLDVSSRFYMTRTLTELHEMKSFQEYFIQAEPIYEIESISVVLFDDEMKDYKMEMGKTMECTQEQLKLIQEMQYSDNFRIDAYFKRAGTDQRDHWTPHISVVPETQAVFSLGGEAFMDYLKGSFAGFTKGVNLEKIEPGKISFTVDKNGAIKNARVKSSCGYQDVDAQALEVIRSAPGMWIPAENARGEKIEQEFYLSFVNMGC
jgi:TonB family protein